MWGSGVISRCLKFVGVNQSQLIVCGYPRGGTSLLYNMLSTTLSEHFTFTSFEKYYIYLIHKLGNIASKAPLDINHLGPVDKLNVNNKSLVIIVVIRDIRDIITSRHPIYNDEYFIGYDNSYWPTNKELTKWAYVGSGVIEITNNIFKVRNRKDVTIIRYEDLVSDPDSIQSELKERYELPFEGVFSKYHEMQHKLAYKYEGKYQASDTSLVLEGSQVVNKQARWRASKFDKRIYEQFTQCPELFDILIEFGYEKDRSWFESYRTKFN
ncbi:sulfotransferase domain-containing protein [Alteromonas sp. ASW11-130]|uniref:sulfotransferase domain-containing protein n=1 Tax=Alteromonas sp. ASW11-130 TaxID=3015775 RepID=UPI002241BBC5|nr:sulfotransferase domain-containing protein [Alteromonas sp. ASW11-130]MCW8091279.1 sulfotransferase domain-containing protein [Alteromonas sp. ASW11-130]